MDFVHVRDVARANILGAKATAGDEVFNVASGTETSLLQLAQGLARVMGREEVDPEFAPERSVNPVPRRLASTDKGRTAARLPGGNSARRGFARAGGLVASRATSHARRRPSWRRSHRDPDRQASSRGSGSRGGACRSCFPAG